MNLYTKQGDGGCSSTMTRMSLPKNSPIFELLGTLDEFTSALGIAKQKAPAEICAIIEPLQQDIIALCGEIAGGGKFATKDKVEHLEKQIDSLTEGTAPFGGFVLPGDSEAGALLDVARTIARRAERRAVTQSQSGGITKETLAWLNRMSDLIYAMARKCDRLEGGQAPSAPASAIVVPPVSNPISSVPLPATGSFCETAAALCKSVRQYALSQGVRVVAAVCDAGGNLVALEREDDAFIASVDVATNKAYTSVALKMTTEEVGKLAQPGASLYGIQFTNGGKVVIFGGGVPLIRSGVIVGGLGVSGGSAEQDTRIANFGAQQFQKEMT